MQTQGQDSDANQTELEVPVLDVCIHDEDGVSITLPPAEHEEFFSSLLKAVACAMNPVGILVGEHKKIIHADNIEQHSGSYSLATHGDAEVEQGIRELLVALESKDYRKLSKACQHYLRKIAALAATHQYDIEFSAPDIDGVLPTIRGVSCSFDIPDEQPVGEETVILGKLLALDKENLRIQLQPTHGPTLDLAVSAEIIRDLEQKQKLTKDIALIGTEYVRRSDNVSVDFKVSKLAPYDSDIPLDEVFRRLKKVVGKQWEHLKTKEDVDAFINDLKSLA